LIRPPARACLRTRYRVRSTGSPQFDPRSRIMNLTRSACSPRSMRRLRACWAVHCPVGCKVTPRMRTRRVACSITARTLAWVPSSKSAVKKSHARIASAWERRNCDHLGRLCPAGSVPPLALRISYGRCCDVDAQASHLAADPPVPHSGFSRASRRTTALMLRRVAGRPAGPGVRGPGSPAAAHDVPMPAHHRVRGNQQPQAPAPRFGYHGEQGREQGHGLPSSAAGDMPAAVAER
jgi:hypothetical protein